MTVRTRFAPSPTGFMHLGGMRTALFNWLWARKHGGQFVLRIDDTDKQRHVEAALQPILDAFRWLGLDWDEGPDVDGPYAPYYQSQRGDLYSAAIRELLDEGKAFYDFDPKAVSQADREAAEKEKRNYLNVRRSLDLSEDDIKQKLNAGDEYVIRFLMPRGEDRSITFEDIVRGEVTVNVSEMVDPVIARSIDSPLYNFATVVDDATMGITHVIRAVEHLNNTIPQLMFYEALGKQPPTFAHLPFITAPGSDKKLSKRDLDKLRNNPQMRHLFGDGDAILSQIGRKLGDEYNPVTVAFYEQLGYLPAGMLNGLARLGWSYDDKTEEMSRDFLIENFDLKQVVKSPAGFDPEKLMSYQHHWMNELPADEKLDGILAILHRAGMADSTDDEATRAHVQQVIETVGDARLRIFGDILQFTEFFTADADLTFDEKGFQKRIMKPEGAVDRLRAVRDRLAGCDDWSAPNLEAEVKGYCESEGIKLGDVIHALRVATTGRTSGAGMFETLSVLGKESVTKRIERAILKAEPF